MKQYDRIIVGGGAAWFVISVQASLSAATVYLTDYTAFHHTIHIRP